MYICIVKIAEIQNLCLVFYSASVYACTCLLSFESAKFSHQSELLFCHYGTKKCRRMFSEGLMVLPLVVIAYEQTLIFTIFAVPVCHTKRLIVYSKVVAVFKV